MQSNLWITFTSSWMWFGIDTGCLQRSSCPQLRSKAPPPIACSCTTLLAPWNGRTRCMHLASCRCICTNGWYFTKITNSSYLVVITLVTSSLVNWDRSVQKLTRQKKKRISVVPLASLSIQKTYLATSWYFYHKHAIKELSRGRYARLKKQKTSQEMLIYRLSERRY